MSGFDNYRRETGETPVGASLPLLVRAKVEERIGEARFILLLSLLIGVLTALAALALHFIIRQIEHLLTSSFLSDQSNWLYLIYPVVGIYFTALFVKYVVKDDIGHGITKILYAISRKGGKIKGHNCWSSVIASAITIGFGGSVGAEAPIVLTGSSIGSNLGKLFNLDTRTIMLLVGCGAAGAVSGIFKAPIAGIVFTLEVLMVDLTMSSLLPLLISSITATAVAYIFTGMDSLFTFHLDSAFVVERIPSSVLLGVFCGLVSTYFIKMSGICEGFFARFKHHFYYRLLMGGTLLSVLIFLFPSLYGEGYSDINLILGGSTETDWSELLSRSLFYGHSNLLLVYVFLVVLTKVFATTATNGSGGCGGTFAPSLFLGCMSGFLFAYLWNFYEIGVYVPVKNYALLGMAGLMSGVMHAPLTGVFLIAELTGGYQLLLPLMIVSVCSYLTSVTFYPYSIYANQLAQQGILITHHTDHAALTLMSLDSVIDKTFDLVTPDMDLGKLVLSISKSEKPMMPVVDAGRHLLGEVDINKIRHILFRTELYHHYQVRQLMVPPKSVLSVNDPMHDVMQKFDETKAQSLPVLDTNGVLVGYITRERMYSMYRKIVADLSED